MKNFNDMNEIIKIKNIFKKFPSQENFIINNISLNLNKGEIVGLVGFNGSGKTTLLRLIGKYIEPTKGEIFFSKLNNDYLPKITLVSSNDRSMFWRLTVKQNLEFFYTINKNNHFGLESKIDEALKHVCCYNLRDKLFMHLSSGQKKLIMIAKAIMLEPDILFFDEATNSLDIKSKFLIYEFLKNYIKGNKDILIIWSTHSFNELDEFCNRVIWIKDGILEEDIKKNENINFYDHFTEKFLKG